jgi:hypothetical protein
MTPQFRFAALLMMSLAIVACAAVQSLKPENVGEGVILAAALVEQGYNSTAALSESGVLSRDDARSTLNRLDTAAREIDAANEAYLAYRDSGGDSAGLSKAERHLSTALSIARSVQVYLQEREQ